MNRIVILMAICQVGMSKKKDKFSVSPRPSALDDDSSFAKVIATNPAGLVNAKVGRDQSEEFTIVEYIGHRKYSYDYEAVRGSYQPNDFRFFVRVVPVGLMGNGPIREYWTRELEFHRLFSGLKNVVKLLEHWDEGDCMFIVYQKCSGQSLEQLAKNGRIRMPDAQIYLNTMISVVESIHNQGVVHGDLQLGNWMLCSEDRVLKLSNFGFAKRATAQNEVGLYHGRIAYRSPECLNEEICSTASDVWSLGIGLVHMLHGEPPVGVVGPNEVHINVPISIQHDEVAWDLLSHLLAINPKTRLTIEAAAEHAWVIRKNIPDMSLFSKWERERASTV